MSSTAPSKDSVLEGLLADNRLATDGLVRVAESVPRRAWTQPLAEEKWSPAQHVHHIALSYEAMVRDVRDGRSAALIGTPWQRRLWRLGGLPQVLWLKRIPAGARAPREIRPPDTSPVPAALLAQFRHSVDAFDDAVRDAWTKRPGHRVQHPYFGGISLQQAVVLCAVHTRHHTAFIAAARA